MPASIMTAREFNQHVSRAKTAARNGPIVITERGEPAYVLLRHSEFLALGGVRPPNALELLSDPNASGIDADFPRLNI